MKYYATTAYPFDVLIFDSADSRDGFVYAKDGRQSITRKQVPTFVAAPAPFSGSYRGVDSDPHGICWFSEINGCIGIVELCTDGSMDRFAA